MILRSLCFGGDFALIVYLFIFCGSLFLRRWFCEKGPKIELSSHSRNNTKRQRYKFKLTRWISGPCFRDNGSMPSKAECFTHSTKQAQTKPRGAATPHRTAPAAPEQSGFQFGRLHKSHAAAKILTEAADVKFGGCFN